MVRSQRTRIGRLESAIAHHELLREQTRDPDVDAERVEKVTIHATNFAYLALLGSPAVNEPLSLAWQRTGFSETETRINPFSGSWNYYWGDKRVAREIHASKLVGIPDIREKENLERIFLSAPAWLVWFTLADLTAEFLSLKLPDLSTVIGCARTKETRLHYPSLPSGTFKCVAWEDWPNPEQLLPRRAPVVGNVRSSRRDRKRAEKLAAQRPPQAPRYLIEWPLRLD